jgi:hypothetical protein
MPRFAVYFVPASSAAIYRLGSDILGYDVRARSRRSGRVNSAWTSLASPYGFHLTIGDAIDFEDSEGVAIENVATEVGEILSCFRPATSFTLSRQTDFAKPRGSDLVLRYDANEPLVVFHTLVAALVNTMGRRSLYHADLGEPGKRKPHEQARIRKFHSWTILDSWAPHFTILNPCPESDRESVKKEMESTFKDEEFQTIDVDSICVMHLTNLAADWTVYAEFNKRGEQPWVRMVHAARDGSSPGV